LTPSDYQRLGGSARYHTRTVDARIRSSPTGEPVGKVTAVYSERDGIAMM
jgi:hypothetical protein